MTNRLWILGAADPEMTAIEKLLADAGEEFAYAVTVDGNRVHPGNAYKADGFSYHLGGAYFTAGSTYGVAVPTVMLVECSVPNIPVDCDGQEGQCWPEIIIDHHREGDPGFGKPPEEFLAASSIGQVVKELTRNFVDLKWPTIERTGNSYGSIGVLRLYEGQWLMSRYAGKSPEQAMLDAELPHPRVEWTLPIDIVFAAAADHCLGAAYRGECPGVDPDELMRWRVRQRAAFQDRAEAEIMADIEEAIDDLQSAPWVALRGGDTVVAVADMRRDIPVPELPEAACRLNVPYISGPLIGLDGRHKYTCSGRPEHIHAFMLWGPANGLTDMYGDPARGFAGGYKA